jgi:hypothetical protein
MSDNAKQASRRDFVKKAAYVAPLIATLAVAPSYAKAGSVKREPRPKDIHHPHHPKTFGMLESRVTVPGISWRRRQH